MRVLLVEDDEDETARYRAFIDTLAGVELVGCVKRVHDAIALTREKEPDAVVLDLELDDSHGMDFLEVLPSFRKSPAVAVITMTVSQYTINTARGMGVDRVYYKHDKSYREKGPSIVMDFLERIYPYVQALNIKRQASLSDREIRTVIRDGLTQIGGSPGSKTLDYTTEAMFILSHRREGAVNLKEDVYEVLAVQFDKKVGTITNGIQYCAEAIWKKASMDPKLESEYEALLSALGVDKNSEPELKNLLLYLAQRFTYLWKGRP